jgi:hypothetical protein
MSRNPRSVHQFRALRALDRFFGLPDARERKKRYDAALDRLRDGDFDLTGPTVAGVERSDDVKGATDPMAHLEEHWLGADYWPSISSDTVKATLRDGYIDAITEAREAELPLYSIWVCATDDAKADTFRVDHVAGPHSVTVAIITPRPAVDV